MSIGQELFNAATSQSYNALRQMGVLMGKQIALHAILTAVRAFASPERKYTVDLDDEEKIETLEQDARNLNSILVDLMSEFNKDTTICRDGTINTLKFDKYTITLDLSSQDSPENSNGEPEHTVK